MVIAKTTQLGQDDRSERVMTHLLSSAMCMLFAVSKVWVQLRKERIEIAMC